MDESICSFTPRIIGAAAYGGLRSLCTGLVVDYSDVIYLSLVGNRASNRAIWAALVERHTVELETTNDGSEFIYCRRNTNYIKREVALPETGLEHLVMLHPQAALPYLKPREDFYVLAETVEAAIPQFGRMLDKSLALPLKPEWAATLWKFGIHKPDPYHYSIITPLLGNRHAKGEAQAWKVDSNMGRWKQALQEGFEGGYFK